MNKKIRHHQFYLPWYAADEHAESWFTYLHRNLHHVEGEDSPFTASSWHTNNDDAELHDEVLDALYKSDKVDASFVTVVVLNRSVSLCGIVSTSEEKCEAENIVKGLDKVWSVTNELVVHVASAGYQSLASRS